MNNSKPIKWKRLTALGITLMMILVMTAGCGGNSGASSGSGSQSSGSGSQSKSTSSGGSSKSAAQSDSGSAKSGSKPLQIQMTVALYDQVPDMNNTYWKYYQKKTNTKLDVEWIPASDYNTKLNLILSSGNLPEVLAAHDLRSPPLVNAVKQGAFWDLTPFLGDFSKYPNMKNHFAPNAWVNGRILGKIYGIPQNRPQVSSAPNIRKDWLDELNLPMPTTIDAYTADLKKIVDAKKATIGLVSKQDLFLGSTGGLSGAFGADRPQYDKKGGLIYEKLTPQFTQFIGWLRQLYAEHILSKEFSVMKSTQAVELLESGKAASLVNESVRWDYPFTQIIKKVQPKANVDSVPPLKGPGGYAVSRSTGIASEFMISKKVPKAKVEQILAYFEKTTTPAYFDLTTYGIKGVHYKVVNGNIVMTPQHSKDMGSSAPWQVLPLYYNKDMKVISVDAPKAYNDAKIKQMTSEGYYDKGVIDPFAVIDSNTWVATWPKYQQNWAAMAVKAVTGQITMKAYEAYVQSLNNNPDFQKAYQEFAENYKQFSSK